jgi:hypothetical protein
MGDFDLVIESLIPTCELRQTSARTDVTDRPAIDLKSCRNECGIQGLGSGRILRRRRVRRQGMFCVDVGSQLCC